MKLTAIRRMLEWAKTHSEGFGLGPHPGYAEAMAEASEVEQALLKAASLTAFATVGLSAFHGYRCGMAPGAYPENAAECSDPRCRAWAAALLEHLPE